MAANLADLFVRVSLKSEDFDQGLRKLSRSMRETGRELITVGRGLTHGLTEPLGAFAVAASLSSETFRRQFDGARHVFEDFATSLADGFAELPAPIQKVTATLLALGLTAGPLLSISGHLTRLIGELAPLAAGTAAAITPWGLLAAAFAAAAFGLTAFLSSSKDSTAAMKSTNELIKEQTENIEKLKKRELELREIREAPVPEARGRGALAEAGEAARSGAKLQTPIIAVAKALEEQALATTKAHAAVEKYAEGLKNLEILETLSGDREDFLNKATALAKGTREELIGILGFEADKYFSLTKQLAAFGQEQAKIAADKEMERHLAQLAKRAEEADDKLESLRQKAKLFGDTQESVQEEVGALKDRIAELKALSDSGDPYAVHKLQALNEELADAEHRLLSFKFGWEAMKATAIQSLDKINALGLDTWRNFSEGFGDAVATILVVGGSFRDAMAKIMQQVAQKAIATVITAMFEFVSAKIVELVFGVVTSWSTLPFGVGIAIGLAEAGAAVIAAKALARKHGGKALAEGGIAMRPSFALFGEAGPEAILPLSKNRLQKYGITGDGQREITLHNHVHVDGREVSRSVVKFMPETLRLKLGGTNI